MYMNALPQVSRLKILAHGAGSGFNTLFSVLFFFLMKICFDNGLLSIKLRCLIFSLHNMKEEIQ